MHKLRDAFQQIFGLLYVHESNTKFSSGVNMLSLFVIYNMDSTCVTNK